MVAQSTRGPYPTSCNKSPQNVRGQNNSLTSILVVWDEVPADQQNNIITGYTITYQSQTENDNGNFQVNASVRQREITGANHSTKISGNFGLKLNGSVRSNRKSFEKSGPSFQVDLFSRLDRSDRNGPFQLTIPTHI